MSEHSDKLAAMYRAASKLDPERRAEFLLQACGDDPALRAEIEPLLAPEGRRGGFPEKLAAEVATAARPAPEIDRYHLLQKIGEGGMGEVWLAEQKEPVRRRVAVKLVKTGMNTREVMARFESERQALALMDHPTIAKVFDAGSTPEGAPYFVMEYVPGVSITTYCDNHRLTTRERLELFMHVCEGVQHAHQKAIIHRDLKPSNILVAELDGKAAPKIIDFGVAKALSQRLTADTLFTRVGVLIGTPEYMSPEQADASREDIDTRTDVYSLGIIFYELLAGAPPLELRKVALEEFLRRLREEDPLKPSTKISTQDAVTSTEVAHKRQTEAPALVKQVRGDLDSIALRALEKERSRRYGSPSDLAADIRRYLNHEAVLAVAPSAAYRARKFARRHRGALVTGCAFVLVLVAAAVVSIRASLRANQQAAVAQAVNDFVRKDLLAQASAANQAGPRAKPDPDLKVRTALDRAAALVTGRFDRQPEVEASIRDTIGETYADLGLYPNARLQLQRALDLHRLALGASHPHTLKTMNELGRVASLQGKFPEAEKLYSQALEGQRRVLGAQHPDTLESMSSLADVYYSQNKLKPAEGLLSQALDLQRRVLGPEHPDTLNSMNSLANLYGLQGKFGQAEALYEQVLEIRRRVLGPEHPATLASMSDLARVDMRLGKSAQAEVLEKQTLEIRRRVMGPEHPDTLRSMNILANFYFERGQYAQAGIFYGQVLQVQRRVLGPEHLETLVSMNNLAEAYAGQNQYAPAEALLRQTLEISRRVMGPEHSDTLAIVSNLGSMYQQQGDYANARMYVAQAFAGQRRTLGADHPDTMASENDVALASVSQGKFTEGEPVAREALELYRKKQPDDWQRFRAESLLGASLAGQKKYAEAEPLLVEGYRGMLARKANMTAQDSYHLDHARTWLVQMYDAWGRPQPAAEFRRH